MKYLLIGVLAAMTVVAVVTIARGEQRDIIAEAYQDPSRSLDTPVHQDIWRGIWLAESGDCRKTLHYGYASDYTKCKK